MGQFHFDVPDRASSYFGNIHWKEAYLCGIEGIPFQTHVDQIGSRLTLSRKVDSSARLIVPCSIPGLGYRAVQTCSLAPSADDQAYDLALELARGSFHLARTQCDTWQRSGLSLNDSFHEKMELAKAAWLESATANDLSARHESAVQAIERFQYAIVDLGELYSDQSIKFRKNREQQLGTLLGAAVIPPDPLSPRTGDHPQDSSNPNWKSYQETFNAIAIRMSWADIETDSGTVDFDATDRLIQASRNAGLRIIAGPIIDFRERMMPHWLYLLEDNFESFLSAATKYVARVVERYRGQVQLWNCAAALNTPGPVPLNDEQAMRLAVGILQTVRRSDPNTAAILSFDQPCGEYLAKHRNAISPMHFADAIIRSGLGMAGLGLECRMGYKSDATYPRSALEIGHMVDRWSTLGMPLLVTLAVPADRGPDVMAGSALSVLDSQSSGEEGDGDQLRMAGPIVRTLLAKHVVHGIVWEGWHDANRHLSSHAGLHDADGEPRLMLKYLTRLRQTFLS